MNRKITKIIGVAAVFLLLCFGAVGIAAADESSNDAGDNTVYINDDDLTEIGENIYKDGQGNYYTYNGKTVKIPLYVKGSATNLKLGGYDIKVQAVDANGQKVALTKIDVENLLENWSGGKQNDTTQDEPGVLIAFSAAGGEGIDIYGKEKYDSFVLVTLTDVEKKSSGAGDSTYSLYVKPDLAFVSSDVKGGTTMFSGMKSDTSTMTIADFDTMLFDAANTNGLVATILVKDLAVLEKYTVADYAGDSYVKGATPSIDLLWERETAEDADIVATFSESLGEGSSVTSWVVDSTLSPYLNDLEGTLSEDLKEITGAFTTKEVTAPTAKVSGTMTLTAKNSAGIDITDEKTVTLQKWVKTPFSFTGLDTIGSPVTVTLSVMGNTVNTQETGTGTTGWDTGAKFPAIDVLTSGDWKPLTVTYKLGGTTTDAAYKITNGGTVKNVFTVDGDLFITQNDLNGTGIGLTDQAVDITMTGYKLGDATMNSFINIGDSSAMGVDILREGTSKLLTGENKLYANVNKTGESATAIDAMDVQWLNKYLVTGTQPAV